MITLRELEIRYPQVRTDLFEIAVELRNLVLEIAPDACEEVRWNGLVYYHARRGGPVSAGICQILFQTDHIRLAFNHGAFLPDPGGLLEGDRIVKRFTRVSSYESARWEELRELISASSRFDPYTQAFREA